MDEMSGFRMGPFGTRLGPEASAKTVQHVRLLQDTGNFLHLTGQGVHFGQ